MSLKSFDLIMSISKPANYQTKVPAVDMFVFKSSFDYANSAAVGTLLLVAMVLAEMVHAIVLHARGRWSTGLAVANTVLALLFAGWTLALFANDLLLSPELLELARTVGDIDAQSMHTLGVILVVSVLAVASWEVVDGWLKTLRDRRR